MPRPLPALVATGDLREADPLDRPANDTCTVPGCERGAHSADHCRSHYNRLRLYGDPTAGGPVRARGAGGSISHGYCFVVVPPEDRHLVPVGRTRDFEHRLVVARQLGRPLREDEVVHQKGQRVVDKMAHALELLQRYDPDAAAALGLDLDPETGLPWNAESPPSLDERL